MSLSEYARSALVAIGIAVWWIVQTRLMMPVAYRQRYHARWLVVVVEWGSMLYVSWLLWADVQNARSLHALFALGILALVPSAIYLSYPAFGERKSLAVLHLFGYALAIIVYLPLSGLLASQMGEALWLACGGALLLVVSRLGTKVPVLTALGVIQLGLSANAIGWTVTALFLLLFGFGYGVYAIHTTWKALNARLINRR